MEYRASRKRYIYLLAGCILLTAGIFGTVSAFQYAVANHIYLRTKYGLFRGTSREIPAVTQPDQAAALRYKASRLDPENYYFSAYVAQLYLTKAIPAATNFYQLRMARKAAETFAREAFALNPYNWEAYTAYAEAQVKQGQKKEAIAFWEKILSRDYWMIDNHHFYVDLLLREGSPESIRKAVADRKMTRGETRRKLDRWARVMNLP